MKHVHKNFDEYVMVCPGTDYGWYMWSDMEKRKNCTALYAPIKDMGKIKKILHHIHFSYQLNGIHDLPFKEVWNSAYSLNDILFNHNKTYCIIFSDNAIMRMSKEWLARLKRQYHLTFVLVIVNKIAPRRRVLERYFGLCDDIFTFDEEDEKKYHFRWTQSVYSSSGYEVDKELPIQQDVFYVGNATGRLGKIVSCWRAFRKHKLKSLFYVCGVQKQYQTEQGIHYNEWLSYDEVVEKVKSSRAVLEIMKENQVGFTMRTFEAILLNKHLITNNKSIVNHKFYDSRYVHVIKSKKDLELITNEVLSVQPDYGYQEELSPLHIIEELENG